MAEQKFGGDWTEIKLQRLEQYLKVYRTIFTGNARARYFTTWYVDAFAGTGSRTEPAVDTQWTRLIEIYDEVAEFAIGMKGLGLNVGAIF